MLGVKSLQAVAQIVLFLLFYKYTIVAKLNIHGVSASSQRGGRSFGISHWKAISFFGSFLNDRKEVLKQIARV